eukprot:352467-Chlamydomonas_euryale.AAC.2
MLGSSRPGAGAAKLAAQWRSGSSATTARRWGAHGPPPAPRAQSAARAAIASPEGECNRAGWQQEHLQCVFRRCAGAERMGKGGGRMGSLLPQLPLPLSLPPHPPTGPSCPQTLTPRYRNPRPRPCHAPARSPCHFRREGAVAAAPSLRLRAARRNRGWPCEAGRLAAGPGGQNDMDGRRPMGRRGHVWNRVSLAAAGTWHAPNLQIRMAGSAWEADVRSSGERLEGGGGGAHVLLRGVNGPCCPLLHPRSTHLEYKYVVRTASGNLVYWRDGSNVCLDVASMPGANMRVLDSWSNDKERLIEVQNSTGKPAPSAPAPPMPSMQAAPAPPQMTAPAPPAPAPPVPAPPAPIEDPIAQATTSSMSELREVMRIHGEIQTRANGEFDTAVVQRSEQCIHVHTSYTFEFGSTLLHCAVLRSALFRSACCLSGGQIRKKWLMGALEGTGGSAKSPSALLPKQDIATGGCISTSIYMAMTCSVHVPSSRACSLCMSVHHHDPLVLADPTAQEVLLADRVLAAANNKAVAMGRALKAARAFPQLPAGKPSKPPE